MRFTSCRSCYVDDDIDVVLFSLSKIYLCSEKLLRFLLSLSTSSSPLVSLLYSVHLTKNLMMMLHQILCSYSCAHIPKVNSTSEEESKKNTRRLLPFLCLGFTCDDVDPLYIQTFSTFLSSDKTMKAEQNCSRNLSCCLLKQVPL